MSHHLRVLTHALQCLSKRDARISPRGSSSNSYIYIDCIKIQSRKIPRGFRKSKCKKRKKEKVYSCASVKKLLFTGVMVM